MEVWQLASVLGLAQPSDKAPSNGGRDLTAERIAAARGNGAKPVARPVARPVDPATMKAMQGQVG